MKLWHCTFNGGSVGYEEFDHMIIRCYTEQEARALARVTAGAAQQEHAIDVKELANHGDYGVVMISNTGS